MPLKLSYLLACYACIIGANAAFAAPPTELQKRLDAAYKATLDRQPGDDALAVNKTPSALDKKAQELESFYIRKMLEQAFPEGEESGLYGGGEGDAFFRSMYIDNLAESWTESGGIGLRERIVKEYTKRNGAYGERTPGNARLLMEGGR